MKLGRKTGILSCLLAPMGKPQTVFSLLKHPSLSNIADIRNWLIREVYAQEFGVCYR